LYPTFSEIDPAKLGPNFVGQKLTTKVANFVNSFCQSVRSAFGGVRKSWENKTSHFSVSFLALLYCCTFGAVRSPPSKPFCV
jgi:hypothetical protein